MYCYYLADVVVIGVSFWDWSGGSGTSRACVGEGVLLAAASLCMLSMSLTSSSDWRPDRALMLKPWLAIIGLFASTLSGGLMVPLGCVLHHPGDRLSALLSGNCWIGVGGIYLL